MGSDHSIKILLPKKKDPISFAPEDSDMLLNAMLVEQVIGTLTRLSPHGRYEPYLAQGWKVSDDGLIWDIQIRPGLSCEDGTEINAKNYLAGLRKVLRILAKHTDIPILNQLVQWTPFLGGKDEFDGLLATDLNTVRFHFASKPSSGFLEYLGLPYMGFYCASNFNEHGEWANSHHAVSSSAYAIIPGSGSFPVRLKKRSNWFSHTAKSPEELIFDSYPFEESLKGFASNVAIYESLENEKESIPGAQTVRLLPSIFSHIVLNSNRSSILHSEKNRAIIRNALSRNKIKNPFVFPGVNLSDALYPHLEKVREVSPKDSENLGKTPLEPLVVIGGFGERPLNKYVRKLLEITLNELEIPFRFLNPDQVKNGYMSGWKDDSQYDIKIDAVDVGGGLENQLIKFMFCSKLGVGLPDPSGRICNLVEEFERQYGDVATESAAREYSHRFGTIMFEDAAVLPVLHYGPSWLLGSAIDSSGFSPNMGIPYFDQVSLK